MNNINLAFCNKNTKIPIWLMRQAGRYLPEYREIRYKIDGFMDLCYNPCIASEITLQPIKRFDFDAAIIFSDILVLPNCLGIKVEFKENIGPVLEKINANSLSSLKMQYDKINNIYEAIRLVRQNLDRKKSLIGFCGGIWTILVYLLGIRKKNNHHNAKLKLSDINELADSTFIKDIIELLIEHTIDHLSNQILAGADMIQIFDSWAGILPKEKFYDYVIAPTRKIVNSLKNKFPEVKIIGFPRNSGSLYINYVSEIRIDGVSCDYNLTLQEILELQKHVLVQGNLDPSILLQDKTLIEEQVSLILTNLAQGKFIFNLGHGILPDTPINNVELMTKLVKKYDRINHQI